MSVQPRRSSAALDLDVDDASKQVSSTIVHFFEFAAPVGYTADIGTLTQTHSGLLHDRVFNTIAGMYPLFDVIQGTWQRGGKGELEATNNGGTRSILRYNGYTGSTWNVVAQTVCRRKSSSSGFPTTIWPLDGGQGNPPVSDHYGMESGISDVGGNVTWAARFDALETGALTIDAGFHNHFTPILHTIGTPAASSYAGSGIAGGTTQANPTFPNLFLVDFTGDTATPMTHDGRFGFSVRWETTNLHNPYPDDVWFDRFSVYESLDVTVVGLPVGTTIEISDKDDTPDAEGVVYAHGGQPTTISSATTAGVSGVLSVNTNWGGYPYNTLKVKYGSTTLATLNTSHQIWGGDVYQYTGPALSLGTICDAGMDIDWNSKTWTGVGRQGISFDATQDTSDLRGMGVNVQFAAVDTATILDVLKPTRHRGGGVFLWRGHLDEVTGQLIGEPKLLGTYFVQGGMEAEEIRPEDASRPGHAIVKVRASSRLAELKNRNGVQSSMESHQRHFPGDTFFRHVPAITNKKVYWGSVAPDTNE